MWAQYALKHTGVCLVFDRAKLTRLIDEQIRAKNRYVIDGGVQYIDRSIVQDIFREQQYVINMNALNVLGRDTYPNWHLQTNFQRLFFEKMTDWKDETEWRWVVFSSVDEDIYVDFKDSLVGIMFADNTDESFVDEVITMTNTWGINYMGLKWKNCSPWYDFANYRYMAKPR